MADYHLLQDKEHYDEEDVALPSIDAENAKVMLSEYLILSLGLCVIALVSGVAIFQLFNLFVFNDPASAEDIFFLAPQGRVITKFTIDERFRQPPSPESDSAWLSILPNGLGVIQHPLLGPEAVSLAFVHQLHCLATIRKSYFAATAHRDREACTTTQTKPDKPATESETDNHSNNNNNTKHMIHCLDYIRQSLQCHADTNLEYRHVSTSTSDNTSSVMMMTTKGKAAGNGNEEGFTGYGEHRCRDFERVVRFAEEWRVYEGKDGMGRVRISKGGEEEEEEEEETMGGGT